MSRKEKGACAKLLSATSTDQDEVPDATMSVIDCMQIEKRHRESATHSYVNCDFIIGSAAEVERLWSIAKHLLKDNHKSMSPLLFEALLFLKLNNSYWDLNLVSKAMIRVRSHRVSARLEEDGEQSVMESTEAAVE